jgi:lysophospholipase L1-like esterase
MDLRNPRAAPRHEPRVDANAESLAQDLSRRLSEGQERLALTDASRTLAGLSSDALRDGEVIPERAAWSSIATVLKAHPALHTGSAAALPDRVWIDTRSASVPAAELNDIALVLIAGALALASEGETADPKVVDRVIDTALGAGPIDLVMRRALLGALDLQRPGDAITRPDLPYWMPAPQFECLDRLRRAVSRLGGFLAAQGTQPTVPVVDVECISSVSPAAGTCGTEVVLRGTFPDPRPDGLYVAFPTNDGGIAEAELVDPSAWSAAQIRVRAPMRVGDGAVGLVTRPAEAGQADPLAAIEFGDALEACVGPATRLTTSPIASLPPMRGLTIPPVIPRLPQGQNVFHGGPVFTSVAPATATLDQALTVTGLNLVPGDSLVLDGNVLKTAFVDPTKLIAVVSGAGVRGGYRSLCIRRGAGCDSNFGSVLIRASLKAPGRLRSRVGEFIPLNGFGFEEGGVRATVEGEPVLVRVVRPDLLEVQARRPLLSAVPANRAGEDVAVEVFHRDVSIVRFTHTLETYRILVFGDSIMWGQGLLELDKFPALVARQVIRGQDTVYALDRSARSGAEVSADGGPSPGAPTSIFDVAAAGPQNATGEVPSSTPSIAAQVAEWVGAPLADARAYVDLVLLDGCINDIGVTTILNPLESDDALATQTATVVGNESTIGDTMTLIGVLESLRLGFDSPRTRLVVTGYYPIVSDRSDLRLLLALLIALGTFAGTTVAAALAGNPLHAAATVPALSLWVRSRLIERSSLFARVANNAMRQAVDTIRQRPGGERFHFIAPAFGPENAIFCPDPWLYGCGFIGEAGILQPEDPIAEARKELCVAISGAPRLTCEIASIGHPNARGAKAYADAILAALK